MSQQPPPPPQQPPYGGQPPYGAPPPYAAPPKKPRPRALWFVVGGVLLVLAPLVFVGALFSVLRPLTQEDAVFAADGQPHQVSVDADAERALFSEDGSPVSCSATDGSGEEIEFRNVTGEFTINEWQALGRFDTGDGELTFTCENASGSDVRIAQLPSTATFVVGLLVGLIVPLVLGLAGIVILIVTGVLFATRPPRSRNAATESGPPSGPGTPAS